MFSFVPFEFPTSRDGKYIGFLDEAGVLRARREQLGLTQQEVADRADIQFSQYQRLEAGERSLSGCSMRIGLAICSVLLLDPCEMVHVPSGQSDPKSLKPLPAFDADMPEDLIPKRPGRKQIRRDIMTIYFNAPFYSIAIPRDVLESVGKPSQIELYWKEDERRILLRPVPQITDNSYDVPPLLYEEGTALVFPKASLIDETKEALGWDDETYAAKCRVVYDANHEKLILCDMKTAKPSEMIEGPFAVPACLVDDDE